MASDIKLQFSGQMCRCRCVIRSSVCVRVRAVYPACLSWTPIAVDQCFFPLALTKRNNWLSFFSETLSLPLPLILCITSALPPDMHSNRFFIPVDLPLNNKLTSLHVGELCLKPQNPRLKVPLLCVFVSLKNKEPKMFPCSKFYIFYIKSLR